MRNRRQLACAALLLGLLLSATATTARGGDVPLPHIDSLLIGYLSGVLTSVDPTDAKAATKVWADMILKRRGAKVESSTLIFNDLPSVERALAKKEVDLFFLLPQQFLEIRNRVPIVPVVVSTPMKGEFEEFVLLVRKDSAVESVRELRGKNMTVETDQKGMLPLTWLETLLIKAGIFGEPKKFFRSIRVAHKPSQAILLVFFQQSDACIVTRNAFDTVAELNPQVEKELRWIALSPGYVTAVGCVREDYYAKNYPALRDHLELLHEDPQGRQILTLFRTGKLLPFKESYLATVEGLLEEHSKLRMKVALRP